MLEGKLVNLRIAEKEDLPVLVQWNNDLEFGGEYEPLEQSSFADFEKWFDSVRPERNGTLLRKKTEAKSVR